MAIIFQKLILALQYMYELSSYAFSGFTNKNYGFYCLRRVKDGKKWNSPKGYVQHKIYGKLMFPWNNIYPLLWEKYHLHKNDYQLAWGTV